MAKNELLPFANGADANVLPTNQWEALTDIIQNGFQSGVAKSEQVNRVLAQGAVASYVLGQLIVNELNKDATLDKDTLYQNLVKALQENAKDACLPLTGGKVSGSVTVEHGYEALIMKVPSSDNYTDIWAKTKTGARLGGMRFTDTDTVRDIGWSINASDYGNSWPISLTLKYDKATGVSTATVGGSEIVTAKGAEFTGYVKFKNGNNARIQSSTDDSFTAYLGGSGWSTGARVVPYGKDHATKPGHLELVSTNGSSTKTILMTPDADPTVGGQTILTTATGMQLSGGTYKSGARIKFADNTSTDTPVIRHGGSEGSRSFNIYARGSNETLGSYLSLSIDGRSFDLCAGDGTNKYILIGRSNGELTWGAKPIITLVESWVSGDNWYRVYSDGWVEQGGKCNNTESAQYTATLFKEMKNSSYTPLVCMTTTSDRIIKVSARTTSTFTVEIQNRGNGAILTGHFHWVVCGYKK